MLRMFVFDQPTCSYHIDVSGNLISGHDVPAALLKEKVHSQRGLSASSQDCCSTYIQNSSVTLSYSPGSSVFSIWTRTVWSSSLYFIPSRMSSMPIGSQSKVGSFEKAGAIVKLTINRFNHKMGGDS